jgi:hypothetical protein
MRERIQMITTFCGTLHRNKTVLTNDIYWTEII